MNWVVVTLPADMSPDGKEHQMVAGLVTGDADYVIRYDSISLSRAAQARDLLNGSE